MPRKTNEIKVTKKAATKVGVKPTGLSIPVYTIEGSKLGSLELKKEIFGASVNEKLIAQASRVYFNNLRAHTGHTKTRGEVAGSTRKIRVQKGTGGARHGAVRAPIFVGGGIALGPRSRKVVLELPKQMKKAALKSALSAKARLGEVVGLAGLEKVSGKTKQMQNLLDKLSKKDVLVILGSQNKKMTQAVRNLPQADVVLADQLNAFVALTRQTLLMSKEAVTKLEERLIK